jgi:hypothetical protein
VNRASPGACFDIGKRPRNLERAEREQVEAGVNTNRRTASSSFIAMSLLEAEVGIGPTLGVHVSKLAGHKGEGIAAQDGGARSRGGHAGNVVSQTAE